MTASMHVGVIMGYILAIRLAAQFLFCKSGELF
jgi:hypothetical protein